MDGGEIKTWSSTAKSHPRHVSVGENCYCCCSWFTLTVEVLHIRNLFIHKLVNIYTTFHIFVRKLKPLCRQKKLRYNERCKTLTLHSFVDCNASSHQAVKNIRWLRRPQSVRRKDRDFADTYLQCEFKIRDSWSLNFLPALILLFVQYGTV